MNAVQMSKLHKLLVWTEKKTDLRNVFFLFLRQDNFSREAFTTHIAIAFNEVNWYNVKNDEFLQGKWKLPSDNSDFGNTRLHE